MVNKQRILYNPPSEAFWDIPNVNYRGETGDYRVFEKMTPAMNQEQLAEFYKQEKPKEHPHPMDSILHFAICNSAYNLKNKSPEEAEKLRAFLQSGFRKYPNTLTRVIYASSEKDKIIHNYKTSDEYSIDAKVIGPDGWFADIPDKNILEYFLGTSDISKVNEAFQWINNTNGYLWRLNSKPSEKKERVVRFGADDVWLDFNCNRGPQVEYPAFQVLRIE